MYVFGRPETTFLSTFATDPIMHTAQQNRSISVGIRKRPYGQGVSGGNDHAFDDPAWASIGWETYPS